MLSDVLDELLYRASNEWTWWWADSNNEDELVPAVVLTILILSLSIFYYLWTFLSSRNQISAPLPPGPRGLPIVGYLPFLGTNLHHQFTELAERYGPIYKLRLGKKLCVVLNSPSLAKEVVRDQDTVFSNRDPPVAALAYTYGGFDIAWASYGSYWRTMRKVFVREMMSNSSLEDTYILRRDEVRKTIRDLHNRIGMGVDIGEMSFLMVFNVVMSMLWGVGMVDRQRADSVGTKFQAAILRIVELLGKPNVSDFFPILARFDLQGVEREVKRLSESVEKIFDSLIDLRMKMNLDEGEEAMLKNKGKKDFIQILLELKEQDTQTPPITLNQIKAVLMDIVVGGTDTTATTVERVMVELMHNPEVMEKVQEELSNIVGLDNIVEEYHLHQLHYLDAVLKETLRLHPALPLLVPKHPSQSSIVGGYTIPKDTCVFLNVWAMHRDPEAWDDPLKFKPERFMSDSGIWGNFQYLPFGSGRRICAGIPLAEKMIMHSLASLLHSFNWKLPEGEELDLSEKFGIVMKKSTPLIAIPTKRLSN